MLFVSVWGALFACGGSDDFSVAPAVIDLTGTWRSSCQAVDSNFQVTEITFANGTVEQERQVYSDETCSLLSGIVSGISGPYSTGAAVNTTDGVTAFELDITITVNNATVVLKDIVYRDGTSLYLSGDANFATRPQSLDFDKVYTLQ